METDRRSLGLVYIKKSRQRRADKEKQKGSGKTGTDDTGTDDTGTDYTGTDKPRK